MRTSPDAVYVIIPCMKELGMSWSEVKTTPRDELVGLLTAHSNYSLIHAFDGYSSSEIKEMAKTNPSVRSDYSRSIAMKERYERRAGKKQAHKGFGAFVAEKERL